MAESEDEDQNPLSEENWMKQNNCKFIKNVIHNRHPMTPEQLKQKPFEEIFKNQHGKVDTEEGESTKVQEGFTTSEELTEDEYSTFSDMSKQDSESNIKMLMILMMSKIHIYLKYCKFIIHMTQQYMIKIF